MKRFPARLNRKLEQRKVQDSFRSLGPRKELLDFSSNDYLGFACSNEIRERTGELVSAQKLLNGATGSRLVTGNHDLYTEAEGLIQEFHDSEAALIYNSGYDANVGFFSSVPGRGDLVFYDELIHASIRDGISMSHARSYKFRHNDLQDLQRQLDRHKPTSAEGEFYIVTESVFSMDGDSPDLEALARLGKDCLLVVDEAHALGVFGKKGEGLVQALGLQEQVFARIVTFGKALGAHGAAILGSQLLKQYLVNFSRSLIYTTALPPHAVATIQVAYEQLMKTFRIETESPLELLRRNISFFNQEKHRLGLQSLFPESTSSIHSFIHPGNEEVRALSRHLENLGFEVKAILSPTVPEGRERLRICLHSYNTSEEIIKLLELLAETKKR